LYHRTIDNQLRSESHDAMIDCVGIADIEIGMLQAQYVVIACQDASHMAANEPRRPGYKHFHRPTLKRTATVIKSTTPEPTREWAQSKSHQG
jgi:hypothetical protein